MSAGVIAASSSINSYFERVLADGPMFYGRVGEASGTVAADSSGNARDATYLNSPIQGASSLLFGGVDASVEFNGSTNAVVNIADASWMHVPTITVEAWFRPDAVSGSRAIVARNALNTTGSTESFEMRQNGATASFTVFTDTGAGAVAASGAASIAINTIYHVVGTYDGSNVKFYLNGSLVATTARSGSMNAGNRDLTIGRGSALSTFRMDGKIDEVAIYSGDIGATKIAAHYTWGNTGHA